MNTKEKKKEKCGDCSKLVLEKERGIQCDVCERWFHSKCKEISEEVYKYLEGDNVSWYCDECKHGVSKLLQSIHKIQARQDNLEKNFSEMVEKVDLLKDKNVKEKEKFNEKLNTISNNVNKFDEKLTVSIKEIENEMKKMQEELQVKIETVDNKMEEISKKIGTEMAGVASDIFEEKMADTERPLFSEILSRKVDDKLGEVSENIIAVQKVIDETKKSAMEERDRENRVNNIVIYRIPESKEEQNVDRAKSDRSFCENLITDILKVGSDGHDIKRIVRLGKFDENRDRPLLVELSGRPVKNLIMENVNKLKNADEIHKKLSIAQDMTRSEREVCKQMVEEAKEQEMNDLSGNWLYRVRGQPGLMKIVKIKKNVNRI